jgi:hypothetical protein
MMHVHGKREGMGRALCNCGLMLLLVILVSWPVGAWGAGAQEMVKFRWAFGALSQTETEFKLQPIGSSSVLKTGDQLKMMVELETDCFVYVIHHSSQGDIKLLFPYSLKQLATDYQQQRKYFIPEGDRWFELDPHVGHETFYLLASTKRLESLERLFEPYEKADSTGKTEFSKQVLDEINTLKRQHRELTAAAERPETIGGAVRGFEKAQGMNRPDVAVIASEISAPSFVARTFNIDHQ